MPLEIMAHSVSFGKQNYGTPWLSIICCPLIGVTLPKRSIVVFANTNIYNYSSQIGYAKQFL